MGYVKRYFQLLWNIIAIYGFIITLEGLSVGDPGSYYIAFVATFIAIAGPIGLAIDRSGK